VHLFGFGENSHSPKLTEIGGRYFVFVGVVAVADDHQVSLRAEAVGYLAMDDLGANVGAAPDFIDNCRFAAGAISSIL
jgi:hypothetical protein